MFLDTVSFLELIYTSAGIDQFLPTRKERMALAANIHFHDFGVLRRTQFKGFAAGAYDRHFVVFGMNIRFHCSFTSLGNSNCISIISAISPFVN